jgi:hypothetical protein
LTIHWAITKLETQVVFRPSRFICTVLQFKAAMFGSTRIVHPPAPMSFIILNLEKESKADRRSNPFLPDRCDSGSLQTHRKTHRAGNQRFECTQVGSLHVPSATLHGQFTSSFFTLHFYTATFIQKYKRRRLPNHHERRQQWHIEYP